MPTLMEAMIRLIEKESGTYYVTYCYLKKITTFTLIHAPSWITIMDQENFTRRLTMKLTKEQQEKFDQVSTSIFDYYDSAYGRIALGQFMEAIEKYPELPLMDIYNLLEPYDEEEEEEEEEDE